MDIYRDAKCRGIYPPLFTNPQGDSCFSIYQIRWINKCCFNFLFWNFRETMRNFSLRSQNSEYPRIFQVTGANQNTRKLLSTDSVNTNNNYDNENNKSNKMYTVNKKNKLNCMQVFSSCSKLLRSLRCEIISIFFLWKWMNIIILSLN